LTIRCRAQLNGAFYQLAFHSDVLGGEQLERLGYDPEGAFYKCAGQVDTQFSSTGGFEKLLPVTNLNSRADYLELANGSARASRWRRVEPMCLTSWTCRK